MRFSIPAARARPGIGGVSKTLPTSLSRPGRAGGRGPRPPPPPCARRGEPYHYIEFVDVTPGSWGYSPHGYSNVVITGYFGWSSVPAELVQRATLESVRHWKARATGDADVVGPDEFGNQIISYRFPAELRRVLDRYRYPVAA